MPTTGGTTTPATGVPAPHGEAAGAGQTPPDAVPLIVEVRFFAGAAAAAGRDGQQVSLAPGARLTDLVTTLHREYGGTLDRVLVASSFLIDGVHAGPEALLGDGDQVDVLPPFAGG